MQISQGNHDILLKFASENPCEEICGLLAGKGEEITRVIPVTNQLHSAFRYRMDPREQYWGFKDIEESHFDLLAIYHSHPSGLAFPSELDLLEHAYPGVKCVIIAPGPSGWYLRLFDLDEKSKRELELKIAPSTASFYPVEGYLPKEKRS